MTSEVVVMNSLAVALAADSAATVSVAGGKKIFNSANKLFMLSKRHPVGIMVYGNSALLDVPWETVIKMFRRELGPAELPRVNDYIDRLLGYLNSNSKLFPVDAQKKHLLLFLRKFLETNVKLPVERKILTEALQNASLSSAEVRTYAAKLINSLVTRWTEYPDAVCFKKGEPKLMISALSGGVHTLLIEMFGRWLFENPEMTALSELCNLVVSKEFIPRGQLAGVVIAGFGKDEHFPRMASFDVSGVIWGIVKTSPPKPLGIDADTRSLVVPFAQSEMVHTFLDGMSPPMQKRMEFELETFTKGIVPSIIQEIGARSKKRRDESAKLLQALFIKHTAKLLDDTNRYRANFHRKPILDAIRHLPKDELAHVASSLVNLNSFQKRMSLNPETVGGPIDVAVISKGDGFIWIDRKHYFKKELNPHFLRNYDQHELTGGGENGTKSGEDENGL